MMYSIQYETFVFLEGTDKKASAVSVKEARKEVGSRNFLAFTLQLWHIPPMKSGCSRETLRLPQEMQMSGSVQSERDISRGSNTVRQPVMKHISICMCNTYLQCFYIFDELRIQASLKNKRQ